jgi:flagellar motility protein MotE (MotC chaperone)
MAVVCVGLGVLSLKPSITDTILNKVEFQIFGHSLAASKAEKTSATKASIAEKNADGKEEEGSVESPSEKDKVSEDISYLKDLRARSRKLDLREAELNELEAELQKQQVEIEQRIGQLTEVRRDIASTLEAKVESDEQKLDKLVAVYSSMEPEQAAEVLKKMDEDLAVKVIGQMKKKVAAEILNVLDADTAKALTEKFVGYQR